MNEQVVLRVLRDGGLRILLSADGSREIEIRQDAPAAVVAVHPGELLDFVRALASVIRGLGGHGGPKVEGEYEEPKRGRPKAKKREGLCKRGHDLSLPNAAWVNPRTHYATCTVCQRAGIRRRAAAKKKLSTPAATACRSVESSRSDSPESPPGPIQGGGR
jgi:hypothetical protein